MPYNEFTGEGIGFAFANYNAHEMPDAVKRALGFYRQKDIWEAIVKNGMKQKSISNCTINCCQCKVEQPCYSRIMLIRGYYMAALLLQFSIRTAKFQAAFCKSN